MAEKGYHFDTLKEQVLAQLREHGYMDSTLTEYRRIYNSVQALIGQRGTDVYTKEDGEAFLHSCKHVDKITLKAYACAIRRLDDFAAGRPYRCHHASVTHEVTEIYAPVLESYLDECRRIRNAPYTISVKRRVCVLFLNHLAQAGCSELSELDAGLVSQALLIYPNKDSYAIVRQFLKHLADKGVTSLDYSSIIPRSRRPKALPTTYSPAEIRKVEDSINTEKSIGKRDLAIIRLATRMGLRSGDIAKLKWSEIDFSTGHISIIQEKTGCPLSLQMPQEVSAALLQHHENLKGAKDGYVFHSLSAPYGRITTSIIRHMVTNSFTVAGVDTAGKKHGPHAFRSSLASSMINDGASYETVRRILGHSDPDVIKHYARTDIEKLRTCSIEPPIPSGLFGDYLSGKKVIGHV